MVYILKRHIPLLILFFSITLFSMEAPLKTDNTLEAVKTFAQLNIAINWRNFRRESQDPFIIRYSKNQDHDDIKNQTECSLFAEKVIQLFVKDCAPLDDCDNVLIKHVYDEKKILYDSWDKCIQKSSSGTYKHEVANDLLTPSTKNRDVFFFWASSSRMHFLTIHKHSNPKKTVWTVYQSWFNQFSLAEWLGVHPWHYDNVESNFSKLYEKYGKGKKLNQEQILAFLSAPLDEEVKFNDAHHVYVRSYKANKENSD